MASVPPSQEEGPFEDRTRVCFFLPVERPEQEEVVVLVTNYLRGLQSKAVGVAGFTHSEFYADRRLFVGHFYDEVEANPDERWQEEATVLFIVDYGMMIENIPAHLRALQQALADMYIQAGTPQKVLWITAERIVRFM